jgi:hypothetical protein
MVYMGACMGACTAWWATYANEGWSGLFCTTEVIQSCTLAVMSSVMYTWDWFLLRKSGSKSR